jgi:macrodomain Ter protein organizer (MatP/YcbG family)
MASLKKGGLLFSISKLFLLFNHCDVYCIKHHHMKKRITISLSEENYIKLQLLAEKKKWSLSKTVEDILERYLAKYKLEKKIADITNEKNNS